MGAPDEIVAYSSITRQLTRLGGAPLVVTLPRAQPLPAPVAAGQRLFHQSARDRPGWCGRTCASCHVDERSDALVWPMANDFAETRSLEKMPPMTAPYGWNGETFD